MSDIQSIARRYSMWLQQPSGESLMLEERQTQIERENYDARERNLEELRREISELEESDAHESEVREWTEDDAREIAEYEAREREAEEEHMDILRARDEQYDYERAEYEAHEREAEEEHIRMLDLARERQDEYERAEEDRERARRYWEENYGEENYGEDEVVRDLPTPLRLDFNQSYQMTEDEWDEAWDRRATRSAELKSKSNPKIGDIVTITIHVNIEIETKMKSEEFDCPICYTSVCKWDAINLNCAHVFCGSCVSTHLDTLHANHRLLPSCALCRTEYAMFEIPNPEISNKIEMMLRK